MWWKRKSQNENLVRLVEQMQHAIVALIAAWEANRDLDQPARDISNPIEEAKRILIASQEAMAK